MLIAAAALLIATFLIIYFGIFYQPGPSANVISLPSGISAVKQPADINVSIFDDDRFKSLQNPPGVPVATDTPGKANPFSD